MGGVRATDRRDLHGRGGVASENFVWGKGWVGGRRPDPGLLVPDASRQEAEANYK